MSIRFYIDIVAAAGQGLREAVEMIDVKGRDVKVLRGCRGADAVRLMQSTTEKSLRGICTRDEYYLWDAMKATHSAVAEALGVDWWTEVDAVFYLRQEVVGITAPTIVFPRSFPALAPTMACLKPLLTGDLIHLRHRRFVGTLSDYVSSTLREKSPRS